jgi:hypothetical protein
MTILWMVENVQDVTLGLLLFGFPWTSVYSYLHEDMPSVVVLRVNPIRFFLKNTIEIRI